MRQHNFELASKLVLQSFVPVGNRGGSNPLSRTTGAHAKGAYKTPPRVSFSMQNRGKLPFSWQFTLFVVSSHIAVGICSSLA
mgnify:CR=1 FL=1